MLGGVLYYMVMTLILWLRLDPNDLKLFTALIVALFLAVPYLQKQSKSSFSRAKKRGQKGGDRTMMLDVNHVYKTFQPGTINERRALAASICILKRAISSP